MPERPPLSVSVSRAATALGVGRSTVYRLIREGELPAFELPGVAGLRLRWSDLEAYVGQAADAAERERESINTAVWSWTS